MYDIVKEAVNDMDSALELSKANKNVNDVVDAVSELSTAEATQLGMNFKKFPIGCDLTEIVVGTCASDLGRDELMGNCMLSNMLGASIHVCAYAFADIAEANNMRGIDILREVREATDVPLDLDHFGRFGAMRFPREIVKCPGQCYNQGPPFQECPRDRIHARLVDKEEAAQDEREEWIKCSSSVAINVTSAQGGEGHAAPLEEAEEIASLAQEYGKGVEAIMFIGDGYDDLVTGFSKALELGADIFVLEGGPFNQSSNRLDSFAKAVAMARILVPGKIVATNGAYEDECRVGLRAGLNAIITGFPSNHHGYMCGYSPGTAKKGNFGLPRVIKIIKEELKPGLTNVPIQRGELEALASSIKVVGPENVYPQKIGEFTLGDAHWAVVPNSPIYEKVEVQRTIQSIHESLTGSSAALIGGRFVSWALARELNKDMDEIIISDKDPWVEKVTVDILNRELPSTVIGASSDDKLASQNADHTIITSTIPGLVRRISGNLDGAITLI
ncbi:5,10-methenyltetrahydromethanopterin hydrogenase cofactor biosynthesis protein HmdC [Methanobacterium formicicum]|uniref:Fibrillarin-like protein n=1 Tax=Methanobacterium formicicum (strain DSM 3637 / PP1) TaxID=1204725 RepID=K2QC76_METFP|nr:5,10-methenyltetrahydromethanopterin hydrogenase cofactor biosynthesis protein HmdC [Methanobacterium formicicum]EKF85601.1 fibrillarin-like protein [Methanobacterium formicicum DSM 3637]